jgi:hypothetical protein
MVEQKMKGISTLTRSIDMVFFLLWVNHERPAIGSWAIHKLKVIIPILAELLIFMLLLYVTCC